MNELVSGVSGDARYWYRVMNQMSSADMKRSYVKQYAVGYIEGRVPWRVLKRVLRGSRLKKPSLRALLSLLETEEEK